MSVLKRINSISKIKSRITKKQAKITFNLDESEFALNNKFGVAAFAKKVVNNIENFEVTTCKQCGSEVLNKDAVLCGQCHNDTI